VRITVADCFSILGSSLEAGVVEDGVADASPTSHEAKAGLGVQYSAFSKARLGSEIPS
jgi:hypothetical protein